VAALVETIPIRLDDNISVPATAAIVLWIASLMTAASADGARGAVVAAVPWAAGVNGVTGWLAYRARTVSRSGAIAGAAVGAVIYVGGGAGAWAMLMLTFLAAAVTSRVGLARKEQLGIAEERGGRRGAGNVIANCGVAAIAAMAAVTTPHAPIARRTVARDAGGVTPSRARSARHRLIHFVTTLRRVTPGTPGAMSLEGTVAGLAAAFLLGRRRRARPDGIRDPDRRGRRRPPARWWRMRSARRSRDRVS
jgi:hypothetical protein